MKLLLLILFSFQLHAKDGTESLPAGKTTTTPQVIPERTTSNFTNEFECATKLSWNSYIAPDEKFYHFESEFFLFPGERESKKGYYYVTPAGAKFYELNVKLAKQTDHPNNEYKIRYNLKIVSPKDKSTLYFFYYPDPKDPHKTRAQQVHTSSFQEWGVKAEDFFELKNIDANDHHAQSNIVEQFKYSIPKVPDRIAHGETLERGEDLVLKDLHETYCRCKRVPGLRDELKAMREDPRAKPYFEKKDKRVPCDDEITSQPFAAESLVAN